MRRPAVFFDRDNTLIVGNDYLGDPKGVVLVTGAGGAVATCRNLGYAIVVVSNQSGVARGLFTENDVAAVNRETERQLREANPEAVVDRHEYCPHHPDGTVDQYKQQCDCRKPKAGMIFAAAEAMALDLKASWMVGDAPRDIAAGKTAGCRTVLIIDPSLAPSPAALAAVDTPADFVVGSLIEAAEVIAQAAARPTPVQRPITPEPAARREAMVETPPTPRVVSTPTPTGPPIPLPAAPAAPPASRSVQPVGPTPAGVDAPASLTAPVSPRPPERRPADPPPATTPTPDAAPRPDLARLEMIGHQVLMELKKLNDTRQDDFSVSKLIAGITQTLALAALPLSYVLYRNDPQVFQAWLLTAIFLQTFTVALLVMGRQR